MSISPVSVDAAPASSRVPLRRVVASAPMRVSFAGGGTDLPGGARDLSGRVVGTAIDLRVEVVVEPFDPGWVELESTAQGAPVRRRRGEAPRMDLPLRLLEAALAGTGVDQGVSIRIDSPILPGSGLGGSGAAAVATLCALQTSCGDAPPPSRLARDAVRVERDRLKLACGAQDQVFAAFGGLLDLRFNEHGCSSVLPLAGTPELVSDLERGLLLVDTQVRRVSGEVLARAEPRLVAATRTELLEAAGEVAAGFAEGSLERVLAGMRRSAAAKVRRDPVGNELAVALAARIEGTGVVVLRTCGAGAGGHVLVWAPPERHPEVLAALGECVVRKPALAAGGVRYDLG